MFMDTLPPPSSTPHFPPSIHPFLLPSLQPSLHLPLQDKEAAWRDDIRAKAAAIQAMQQQAKKKSKK